MLFLGIKKSRISFVRKFGMMGICQDIAESSALCRNIILEAKFAFLGVNISEILRFRKYDTPQYLTILSQ